MSVEEHKAEAPTGPVKVQVVVVSSSREVATDESGALIAELFVGAGHQVLGRQVVPDGTDRVRAVVSGLVGDGETQVVVLTGGTGVSGLDQTPEAVRPLFGRELPGFGELFRLLSFQEVGSAAILTRATAGVVGTVPVFLLPGSAAACRLAVDKLILPELGHLLGELSKEGGAVAAPEPVQEEEVVDVEAEEVEEDGLPAPSGSLGKLGRGKLQMTSEQVVSEAPAADDQPEAITGWLRAVREIEAEVIHEKREDIPWNIESIAPVVNVLETSGEQAVLKLPSGVKYSLWGWPDLRRPESKVLAVGWGEPLAEVLALHRYPVLTGLCIDEERGLLPSRSTSVEDVCEEVTGRKPRDTSGTLFAVGPDAVLIERGSAVYRWDGRREENMGTPKQALSTLMIHWSNR